jgi:hypothetical protein
MEEPATPIPWDFRWRTVVCSEALLRIFNAALDLFGDDLESTLIYLCVCCACVSGALRDPALIIEPPPSGLMPPEYYRPVSRRAIAASTGLPRETVRRKIAALVARGDLIATQGGVRIRYGLLDEDPRSFRFAEVLIREFSRTGPRLAAAAP